MVARVAAAWILQAGAAHHATGVRKRKKTLPIAYMNQSLRWARAHAHLVSHSDARSE